MIAGGGSGRTPGSRVGQLKAYCSTVTGGVCNRGGGGRNRISGGTVEGEGII